MQTRTLYFQRREITARLLHRHTIITETIIAAINCTLTRVKTYLSRALSFVCPVVDRISMCDVELVSDVVRLSDYTVQLLLLYRIRKYQATPAAE